MFTSVKDSGVRIEYENGGSREPATGKGRYDLIPAYPFRRLAIHFQNGYKKYGSSWMKGLPMHRYFDSMERHIATFKQNDREEDHIAAILWGLYCYMDTERRILTGEINIKFFDVPWSIHFAKTVLKPVPKPASESTNDSNIVSSNVGNETSTDISLDTESTSTTLTSTTMSASTTSSSSSTTTSTKKLKVHIPTRNIIEWKIHDHKDEQQISATDENAIGRYDLIPSASHERVAKCYEKQIQQMPEKDWETSWPLSRFIDGLERHIYFFKEGNCQQDHLALAIFYAFGYLKCEQDIRLSKKPLAFNDVEWKFSIQKDDSLFE